MESTDQEAQNENTEDKTQFKMPVLVGRVGKLPKKSKPPTQTPQNETVEPVTQPEDEPTPVADTPKTSLPSEVLLKELSTPIPYKEPKWSGLCPDGSEYALEVLKSGLIVDKVELTKKPFYVFGRLANNDVVMQHPTISRNHAVLQYKLFADESEPPPGWYLYDLNSTHGTYLNRDKIKPNTYTRVRVGHQIKFGNSTRTYIVLGPDFDSEGESDLTVTEIKQRTQQMKVERDRMILVAKEAREKERLEEERRKADEGIDWGMGEDADDEPDLSENPFAATTNEELYLDDPKKTLRGYYEREGLDLVYDCQERGIGQFVCRVELPLDDPSGRPVIAEVIHKGKKKESVIACALEACRILDRAGLLRQAKHESRRRKARDWSADDYYDSDDDTFLDRTGAVERKRDLRMKKHGGDAQTDEAPHTYDTLLKKISEIEKQISIEETHLQSLRDSGKVQEINEDGDSLDNFMTHLSKGHSMAQKAEISNTKMSIQKMRAELTKTQRLAEIARPAHLPPLIKKQDNPKMGVKINNSVVYGKRLKLKEDLIKKPKAREPHKQQEHYDEEVESDDETETNKIDIEKSKNNIKDKSSIEIKDKSDSEGKSEKGRQTDEHESFADNATNDKNKSIEDKFERLDEINKKETKHKSKETKDSRDKERQTDGENKSKVESESTKRVFGPMKPPDNYVLPEGYFEQINDRDLPEIEEE